MEEEEKNGKRFALKMGSMIISGILGLTALIGIFWGKPELITIGITTVVVLVFAVIMIGNTY